RSIGDPPSAPAALVCVSAAESPRAFDHSGKRNRGWDYVGSYQAFDWVWICGPAVGLRGRSCAPGPSLCRSGPTRRRRASLLRRLLLPQMVKAGVRGPATLAGARVTGPCWVSPERPGVFRQSAPRGSLSTGAHHPAASAIAGGRESLGD